MTRTSCLGTAKCIFKIFIWGEMCLFWFSSVILLNFLPKIKRYWTTFETLAEIERDYKERQLCMGDWSTSLDNVRHGHYQNSTCPANHGYGRNKKYYRLNIPNSSACKTRRDNGPNWMFASGKILIERVASNIQSYLWVIQVHNQLMPCMRLTVMKMTMVKTELLGISELAY